MREQVSNLLFVKLHTSVQGTCLWLPISSSTLPSSGNVRNNVTIIRSIAGKHSEGYGSCNGIFFLRNVLPIMIGNDWEHDWELGWEPSFSSFTFSAFHAFTHLQIIIHNKIAIAMNKYNYNYYTIYTTDWDNQIKKKDASTHHSKGIPENNNKKKTFCRLIQHRALSGENDGYGGQADSWTKDEKKKGNMRPSFDGTSINLPAISSGARPRCPLPHQTRTHRCLAGKTAYIEHEIALWMIANPESIPIVIQFCKNPGNLWPKSGLLGLKTQH